MSAVIDPFSPPPRRAAAPPPESVREPTLPRLERPKDLDTLRKDVLVALATERGLDPDGTRVELIARIRAHHAGD